LFLKIAVHLFTLQNATGFSSPGLSLMSTSIMMLGNIDFLEVWMNPFADNQLPNPTLNFVMLILFVLFMPILLINLMVIIIIIILFISDNECP
jgi:hypothetical protein